jgi:hypothetical protein
MNKVPDFGNGPHDQYDNLWKLVPNFIVFSA